MRKVTKGSVIIKLWDVGGQPRFQSMWERYCRGVQVIVYVVDAADHDTIEQTAKLLHDLMQRPSVRGVPLLVLGNKSDLPHALSSSELSDRMRLDVRCSLAVLSCTSACVPWGECVGLERGAADLDHALRMPCRSSVERYQCTASRAKTRPTSTWCLTG